MCRTAPGTKQVFSQILNEWMNDSTMEIGSEKGEIGVKTVRWEAFEIIQAGNAERLNEG